MDTVSAMRRSQIMALVKSKNTGPEMTVRRLVHSLGYRYSLHRRDLPGTPDLCFPSRGRVIFVHGCFWHRHASKTCGLARMPKSRKRFWTKKLDANKLRDESNIRRLRRMGWKVLVVWECQIGHHEQLRNKLGRFFHAELDRH